MIRKYLLSLLFILGLIPLCIAQRDALVDYQEAQKQIQVLKNNSIFPLNNLDTLKVAFITEDENPYLNCLEVLNRYTKVYPETLPANLGLIPSWIDQLRDRYDQFVVGINLKGKNGKSMALMSRLVNTVFAQNEGVLLIFGTLEEPGKWIATERVQALIQAPATSTGESLAAQMVFGGFSKDKYRPASRLGYTPPEALGVNGQLLRDSIAAIVTHGLETEAYPGAQVLVAYQGQVIYHETFGHHTYADEKEVQKTDVYDLASVSKVSSALAALMKWHGEGSFDLDAPLKAYYPDFAKSNKAELPFRQMLAHNARLRPWIPYWKGTLKQHPKYPWKKNWDNERINDFQFKRKTLSKDSSEVYSRYLSEGLWQHKDYQEQMMKAIRKSPLNENPGYVYSGLLFYLLPDIVAQRSGMDYETYLKKTFYQKLGAHSITFNPLRYIPKSKIIPTERDTFFRMTQIHGYVHDEGAAMMGGVSANAGLFSSANDLAKLFQMYMNYGSYGGEQLIEEEALKTFTSCQYCEEGNHRGLGFDKPLIEYNARASSVAEAASAASFGHSGYTGTFAWADPEKELLFIFLSNRVYPTRLNRKLYQLNIRPRIHKVLYEAIGQN